ncbi:MAG: type III pantothenate kinase [Brumimicrobium sp.]|nr:type III pantothenate kinase [Brumimicrobium sp.]
MDEEEFIIVDAGNTRVKVARFQKDEPTEIRAFNPADEATLFTYLNGFKNKPSILSSVVSEELMAKIERNLNPTVVLSSNTKLPVRFDNYLTPETLGADRISNAVAIHSLAKGNNALSVDIGTCIKFDFVDNQGIYLGGSISPGMRMRFRAMHDYTGKLPLIEPGESWGLIGNSTFASMNNGVMTGIAYEIKGMIDRYNQQFAPLTIFLTGGDHKRFDIEGKNTIFADDNLTLRGLYLILKYNVQ